MPFSWKGGTDPEKKAVGVELSPVWGHHRWFESSPLVRKEVLTRNRMRLEWSLVQLGVIIGGSGRALYGGRATASGTAVPGGRGAKSAYNAGSPSVAWPDRPGCLRFEILRFEV